jgi:hypothetical protein
MQEVNELMNEMSEFYDESEETSDLIEERLAKTINTSLRANISPNSFSVTLLFVCVMLLKLSFMIGLKLSLPY